MIYLLKSFTRKSISLITTLSLVFISFLFFTKIVKAEGYIEIETCGELAVIGQELPGSGDYHITQNLDCTGVELSLTNFSGTLSSVDPENPITISNVTINKPADSEVGIFKNITGGSISNIIISDASVTGNYNVGVLVGAGNTGSYVIDNITIINSTVTANDTVGMLAGNLSENSIVSNVSIQGGTVYANAYSVGGLIGEVYGYPFTIENATSSADIIVSPQSEGGSESIGGLIGYDGNYSIVTDSYATGDITINAQGNVYSVGGLIGLTYSKTQVENTYATGNITINTNGKTLINVGSIGGLIGYLCDDEAGCSVVTDSYATGDITINAQGNVYSVGGLIGLTYSKTQVENTYATGNITINTNGKTLINVGSIGGLIGYLCDDEAGCSVKDSYSTGTISILNNLNNDGEEISVEYIGGFIGYVYTTEIILEENFTTSDIVITGPFNNGYINTIGGFAGYVNGYDSLLQNNYAKNNITIDNSGNSDIYLIGGFIGQYYDEEGNISKNYSVGNISLSTTGEISNVGGFIGQMYYGYTNVEYNFRGGTLGISGIVGNNIGGFIGYPGQNIVASEDYLYNYLYHSDDYNYCYGYNEEWNSETETCQTVESLDYFKNNSNKPFDSWDFDYVWDIASGKNDGFPYLQWYDPEEIEETPILGCTNSRAKNYNPSATEDDGSCRFRTISSGSIPSSLKNNNQTIEQLMAQIKQLQLLLAELQSKNTLPSSENPSCSPFLRQGSKGEDVKKLQQKLGVKPVSGIFGPITLQAVKDFQKSKGLRVDGIAGIETCSKI